MSVRIAIVFVGWLLAVAAPAAAKTYRAERFDVSAEVQLDRSIVVRETVVFRFEEGTFTTVHRKLPTRRSDGVVDVSATLDGRPVPAGAGLERVEIGGGDPVVVRWHFPAITRRTHTFGLQYRLAGVVRQEDERDVLTWNAFPTDHDYRIDQATATLAYPVSSRLLGTPLALITPRREGERPRVMLSTGRVRVSVTQLGRNGSVRLSLVLAPGVLTAAAPVWQARARARAERGPLMLAVAGAIALAGFGWLVTFWSAWRRPLGRVDHGPRESSPPDPGLPVAIAGQLAGGQRTHVALAALVDLARRGVLRVTERPRVSRWSSRQFGIELAAEPGVLPSHEHALLEAAFGTAPRRAGETTLAGVQRALAARRGRAVYKALAADMRAAGLVDPERAAARRMVGIATASLAGAGAASLAAAAVLLRWFGAWAFALPASVLAVAAGAGVVTASLSVLSVEGVRQARRWRRFAAHLRDVAKGGAPVIAANHADWLPYALAAGVGSAWAKQAAAVANAPAWFRAVEAQRGAANDAFVAFAGHAASTSSNGTTASSAVGTSSAAAGGGASGAH